MSGNQYIHITSEVTNMYEVFPGSQDFSGRKLDIFCP